MLLCHLQCSRNIITRTLSTLPRRRYTSSTSAPFKVLFFGRDEFSCLVLQQVLEAKDVWQDIQVVTQPDTKTGRRGSKLSISPLKVLAEEANLPVHSIPHIRSDFKIWQAPPPFYGAPDPGVVDTPSSQHLLVTASFGRILPNSLLKLFNASRRVNIHPSVLPAYRGAAPIQHAIIDGQHETGVCVIEMTERKKGIDSGAIWASERMPVSKDATFPILRDSLARIGGQLLVSVMRDMMNGKDTRQPQYHDPNAPRAPLITADDSQLDFKSMTANRIVCLHRAISHQKPMTTKLKTGATLQLHEPSVMGDFDAKEPWVPHSPGLAHFHPSLDALVVRCADDTFLRVPKVRQQDRGLLRAKEWWNGVKPEMRLHDDRHGPVEFVPFNPSP